MSPATIGFLRGLGMVVLTAILAFVGDQGNLSFLSPQISLVVSGFALFLEGMVEKSSGNPLFGAVTRA